MAISAYIDISRRRVRRESISLSRIGTPAPPFLIFPHFARLFHARFLSWIATNVPIRTRHGIRAAFSTLGRKKIFMLPRYTYYARQRIAHFHYR